tara:strand:+ start:1166 stop:1372 length:207 start_codon:yes stop_codon:yes gene_type:complete
MKKFLNGELVDMSTEEIESEKIHLQNKKTEKDAIVSAKNAKATNEASAIAKLKALGLTDDEITAMIGE